MDELISEHASLIYSIAKKFYNVDKEDLYQAGCLGLIKAYNNYKDSNVKFASYAYKYIFGEMYELSLRCRDIKLSKECLQLLKKINIASTTLAQSLNRSVTLQDISEFLEIDLEKIEYVTMIAMETLSLDDDYQEINVGVAEDYDQNLMFEEYASTLDPLSSAVMNYRFKEDLTQSEVAKVLGISQVKVSRIEKNNKEKMLEYIS